MTTVQQRLRAALPVAMKARDKPAVTALRSALAAIDNAAAVAPGDPVETTSGAFAQAAVGLGVTEAARRDQDEAEIAGIVRTEIAERLAAADEYDRLSRPEQAAQKRAEAQALAAYV